MILLGARKPQGNPSRMLGLTLGDWCYFWPGARAFLKGIVSWSSLTRAIETVLHNQTQPGFARTTHWGH